MKKNNSFVIWCVFAVVVLVVVAALEFDVSATNQSLSNTAPISSGSTHTSGSTGAIQTTLGSLDGTTLRYTSYDANIIPSGENYLLSFSAGQVRGSICNSFSGPYTARSGVINATLTSTAKACSSPKDITAAEQIFMKTFSSQAPSYTFDGQKLSITGNGHTVVFNAFAK